MAVCRPRGGRSAPRYHHIRDASEERMWRMLHHQEKPKQSEVDEMCKRLAVYTLAMDTMLANVKEKMK